MEAGCRCKFYHHSPQISFGPFRAQRSCLMLLNPHTSLLFPSFTGLTMYWLWKLREACVRWGPQSRTVHLYASRHTALQWGHQEVPDKFNFVSDVIDHWAGMEKVMNEWGGGLRRGFSGIYPLIPSVCREICIYQSFVPTSVGNE